MKRFSVGAWLLPWFLAAGSALAQPAPPPALAPLPSAPPAAAPGPPPLADTLMGEAKAEYEAGKLLYEDSDFAGASLKFQRAHELSKDARLLWNRAAAEKNLRHYAVVSELVERYLLEGGVKITDAERLDAETLIQMVSGFIAKLTVVVNQPGAAITVDGQSVGTSPLPKPLLVDMGQREIKVGLQGFKPATRVIQLSGGGSTTLDVALEADKHEGILRIVVGHDAVIRVDGKMVGMGQWQGTLPSGVHTVEASAKGKLPYVSDSLVQDDQTATLRITLQDEAKPIIQESGVPTWMWLGGAAVLAAGAGIGGYFLLKPDDKGPPPPVEGSIGTVPLPFRL